MSSLVVMGLFFSAAAGTVAAAPASSPSQPAPPPTPAVLLSAAATPSVPAAVSAPSAVAPSPPRQEQGPRERIVRHSRPQFDTLVEIMASVSTDDEARATVPFDAAFDEVKRVEALVDEESAASPVWRINQQAGGEPVVVDPELFSVLSELHRIAKLTRGAFDITAAAYDTAWHFASDAAPTADPEGGDDSVAGRPPMPEKDDIEKVRKLVGFDSLVLDPAARTARLSTKGARIGVRSVARGYALERAAGLLVQMGIENFVISAGGDLVVRGQKGVRPWMVGVQDPRAAGHFAALSLSGGAVMTTGDYEDFFFDGGVRYHNVIDPRTGQPATKSRSVTVIAKDALTAEALARALFVMGARDGIALVERLKDVDAVVVTQENKVVLSRGIRSSIQVRPPTDGP